MTKNNFPKNIAGRVSGTDLLLLHTVLLLAVGLAVLRLCQNNLRHFGRHSQEGAAALKIRKSYNAIKQEYHAALLEILESGNNNNGGGSKEGGEEAPSAAVAEAAAAAAASSSSSSSSSAAAAAGARCFERPAAEEEAQDEVIRCPCGQFRDEGLMVQCEQCLVWQHGDCVGLPEGGLAEDEKYLCEK